MDRLNIFSPNFRPKCDAPNVFSNHGKFCNILSWEKCPFNLNFFIRFLKMIIFTPNTTSGAWTLSDPTVVSDLAVDWDPGKQKTGWVWRQKLNQYCFCEVKQKFYCPDYFCVGRQCCLLQPSGRFGRFEIIWERGNEDAASFQRSWTLGSAASVSGGSWWRLYQTKWGRLLFQDWRSSCQWTDSSVHAPHHDDQES